MPTILLVDDANLVLEVEKALLRRTGAQLLTASNGTDALRLLLSSHPDLVLLDLMLPDITGDKICEQIKKHPQTFAIPVIMVTTRSNLEDIERCRRAGCDDYTTKPINHQELLTKVMELLRRPRRRSRRILVRLETELSQDRSVFFGSSVDLSTHGLLMESAKVLTTGDRIALRFLLQGQNEVAVHGKVLRTEKLVFRKFRYGIEFEDLSANDQQKITEFINAS